MASSFICPQHFSALRRRLGVAAGLATSLLAAAPFTLAQSTAPVIIKFSHVEPAALR